MKPIIIVGAGMAAYALARALRKHDTTGPIRLISSDSGASYAKPMLSNAFLLGKDARQLVAHEASQMAAQLDIEVLANSTVSAIDPTTASLTANGVRHDYSALVLALGAQPIRLALAGDAAERVLSVNHLAHYAELRARLQALGRPAHVAILGAGLIGCEFADDLVAGGHQVTLLDPQLLPLSALAAPSLSNGLLAAWRRLPIRFLSGASAVSVEHADGSLRVTLADGRSVDADLVLSAVGLRPQCELAKAAGLLTRRGIVVDALGQTSAAGVYALGDCAEYDAGNGAGQVLPYVQPMMAAAQAIAATLAGKPTPIALKRDAVLVKTSSYRIALAAPPPGAHGSWTSSSTGEHTIARFSDDDGMLLGFGISSPTLAVRQQLLGELGTAPLAAGASPVSQAALSASLSKV